jgi:hypothetical protein
MGTKAHLLLRLLGVALVAPVTAASAQEAPPACIISGRVEAHGIPLPGVLVRLPQQDGATVITSTDERGLWQVTTRPGPSRLIFTLHGFRRVDQTIEPAGRCGATLETILEVEAPAETPRQSAAQPVPRNDAASVVVLRGRDARINRSLLRARAAAVARGDIALAGDPYPERLFAGVQRLDESITPTPLPRGGAALVAGRVGSPSVAARAPGPVVPANRLLAATASYTVAGSALDSTPYQLRADTRLPKPSYQRQSVDVTIGGPLRLPGRNTGGSAPNITLSYSAIRGGNLFDQYATVPTAAMRAGDFSGLGVDVRDPLTGRPFENARVPADRIDATAQALLTLLPLPTGNGRQRNFHFTSTNRSTQDSVNLRLTHALSGAAADTRSPARRARGQQAATAATLNGQVEFRRNVNDRLSALPAIAGIGETSTLRIPLSLNVNRRGTQQSISVAFTRNTTATANRYAGVFDVAGAAGIAGASRDPFTWGVPTLSFASLTTVGDLTPATRTDQRVTLGYSWSRGAGPPRVRAGIDGGYSRSASRTDQNARGTFVFTGLYSGTDVSDFLLGMPQQASVQYGPGLVHLGGRSLSLYAQDDWRRWSNVTLNAGIRYELVTPFSERDGRLVNLDVAPGFTGVAPVVAGASGASSDRYPAALVHTDWNNLAPRVGLAWRLAPRTTLRVGYGVSFNTGSYSGLARQLAAQPPFAVTNTALGAPTAPLTTATALTTTTTATTNTFGVARDYEAGQVRTWSLDLNRDMGDAWNLSAGLTYAAGSALDIVRAPNRGPDGLRLPDVQPFLWQTSEGRSQLRAANLRVRRWYVRGFSLSANYAFSDSKDNASTIGGGATVVAQDEQNLAAEWGPSSFNRRHRLSGDLNFELPFGDTHRWLNRGGVWATVFGRWSAYLTFSAQTGTPLTARVLSNVADVSRGTNGTLRADLTGAPIGVSNPSVDRYFNTSAFALPQTGQFGTSGRNVIQGPGSRDISVQLTRDVTVGGRTVSIQVRTTNVFNLLNYQNVDTVVNSPTFGQVLSVGPLRSTQVNVRWRL